MSSFDYLSRNPEQARVFDDAMVGAHGQETPAILRSYDFSGVDVLVDIGAGNGSLLMTILQKYPALRGIVFDLPGVATRARRLVEATDLAERCQVVGGSFFDAIPTGADAYLARHILHDWDDASALDILRTIHRAMPPRGKLLVVEGIVAPGNDPSFTKLLDLNMLVILGGRERTEQEYRTLLEEGGFQVTRVIPTEAEVSVIEAKVSE